MKNLFLCLAILGLLFALVTPAAAVVTASSGGAFATTGVTVAIQSVSPLACAPAVAMPPPADPCAPAVMAGVPIVAAPPVLGYGSGRSAVTVGVGVGAVRPIFGYGGSRSAVTGGVGIGGPRRETARTREGRFGRRVSVAKVRN